VASYVYWPYGHGIPLGEIYQRYGQIDSAYNGTAGDLASVVREFNVSYVYVGNEETGYYGIGVISHLDSINWIKTVYSDGTLRVYQVDTTKMPT
jgi:uncharacterized membrane protein